MSEFINLHNTSWEELLPQLNYKSVDLLYTDPPFGISFQSGAREEQHKKIANDDNLDWLPGWVNAIKRVMKDDSHMYIWCSWHKVDVFKQALERYWKIKNLIVWAKNGGGMGDLGGGYGGCHELLFFINNGKDLNGRRDTDVITKAYRTGNVYHPTQKPWELAQWILSKSTKDGDLVLDTFSGSGSTAIACHKMRRKFVGCELDKDFYEASLKHIEVETMQIEMF